MEIEILNADSENWFEDLEIKVKNVGKKPIYFLDFAIVFDGLKSEQGLPISIGLEYGDGNKFLPLNNLTEGEDNRILYGEFEVLKSRQANSFKKWCEKNIITGKLTATLDFRWLSFGDGTGIMKNGVFFPVKKKTNN